MNRNSHYSRKPRDGGQASGPDQTRLALIRAALTQFGRFGYDGATTRDIAAEAKANIGSIAYHFGGKEGLHEACARHIVDTMQELARPVLTALPDAGSLQPDQAEALLRLALERMAGFVIGQPEAGAIVSFILRELDRPTAALGCASSRIMNCAMSPASGRATRNATMRSTASESRALASLGSVISAVSAGLAIAFMVSTIKSAQAAYSPSLPPK